MLEAPEKTLQDSKAQTIIAAARTLFLDRGYSATSMDDIAELARVSKTTLYKRYPSKVVLFAAVIAARTELSGMEFRPEELSEFSIDEALIEIATRFVDLICAPDSQRLELVYHSEAARFPEVAAAFRRGGPEHAIAVVEDYFRVAGERGLIAVADPRFAAIQFLVALKGDPYGIASSRGANGSRESKSDHIRKVVQLFLDGARPRI